jgi:hypothetical protein
MADKALLWGIFLVPAGVIGGIVGAIASTNKLTGAATGAALAVAATFIGLGGVSDMTQQPTHTRPQKFLNKSQ